MFMLEDYKSEIHKMIQDICTALNIDAAIFDVKNHLVDSTEYYLQQKGQAVHAPSIEEVISNGKVIVSNPGYMQSCKGCRFKDNCPAKIEMLNCIKIKNEPIGVFSLTSFTQEGCNRIIQNENMYINILNLISQLISFYIDKRYTENEYSYYRKAFQETIDSSKDSILAVDNNGMIKQFNYSALKLFSVCSLNKACISEILPANINNKILDGSCMLNEISEIDNHNAKLSVYPIDINNNFNGAVIRAHNESFSKKLDKRIYDTSIVTLDSIKGKSDAIQNLKKKASKIADSTSTVLITGETGTGKGLLARAIHFISNRSNYPLVLVNCATIPENLFESELFGFEEGAFTGAKKGGKKGKFELAQNGTIFLDEIGELPFHIQSKLLTVLQDHTIERVGGTTSIPIDVRVIAATNQNIEEMIKEKKFRADLFYRLNVIPLNIPPLRQRQEDIEILAEEFLKKYSLELKRNIISFSPQVLEIFKSYDWPGNIRELENIVEYSVNMEEKSFITLESLPEKFLQNNLNSNLNIKDKIKHIEVQTIKDALDRYGWNLEGKKRAAKELDISLRTLYRKIKD